MGAFRAFVPDFQTDLPTIAFRNINGCPIAPDWQRFAVLALPSHTPVSGCPKFVASRANHVKLGLAAQVFGAPELVQVCIPFLNGFLTDDWPVWRNKNRVARVMRGDGGGIVVVSRLNKPLIDCGEDLLGCLWVRQVVLLGVSRQSKADCQT